MPALLLTLLPLLRRIWPYALAGVALIGAYLWIDHRGYARGAAEIEARDAKAAARIEAAAVKLRAADQAIAARFGTSTTAQQIETREVYHEALKIVDRPIYRSVCVDADGSGLLDRARANADRPLAGEPADGATGPPAVPAQP